MKVVVKRSGDEHDFAREKLERRASRLLGGLDPDHVDPKRVMTLMMKNVAAQQMDKPSTQKLDDLLAEAACYLGTYHPDYLHLAGRIAATNLQKRTEESFSKVIAKLHHHVNPRNGQKAPLVSKDIFDLVQSNHVEFDGAIDWQRDLQFDYFGFKTLENSYLLRVDLPDGERRVVERPQHLFLRVAVGIWGTDTRKVLETYDLLSKGYFMHASPTLFNAGSPSQQLASSFLVAMKDDSIDGIYDTLKSCAVIARRAGGIGLWMHNIRASGAYICGTNGVASGLVPILRIFDNTAVYVDRGGKRQGAFAINLEPWHADIFDVLKLRQNAENGGQAHGLSYVLWLPDLFMRRVERNGMWSLFCPAEVPDLADVWGDSFVQLYERYEREGKQRRSLKAQDLWFAILNAQIQTGSPCMAYKDACNSKSNQQNVGTVKSSGLCCEVTGYTSTDETLTSVQASIALPKFVVDVDGQKKFDHQKLKEVTHIVTRNLNRIIDINCYPTEESRKSSERHRPIGIGVQGLADAFFCLQMPFTSPEAQQLNQDIFETIYFGALEASMELAQCYGTYETYRGSPVDKGKLQFDMWGITPKSGRWDWADLKQRIARHGVRNALLVAPMPTSSTAKILGNSECFEPSSSMVMTRRLPSAEIPIINRHLVHDLVRLGRWNDDIRNLIIAHGGSIAKLADIPSHIKDLYRTVWEVKGKDLVDMAASRCTFVDQSCSLNLFLERPTLAQLTSMHFYAWKRGLKTGMYMLRRKPKDTDAGRNGQPTSMQMMGHPVAPNPA
mmetsp:Transcript_45195/g.80851  ORF Transcript_45195/g.80851 Transcript_45195/m.80851 type:complete len:782 (-) Transcript_45195:830-3175(-)